MNNKRATTQAERLAIVKDCIELGRNFGATATKYNVSYHQVRQWVIKYTELGEAGLEDRRGHRLASQRPRSETEDDRIMTAASKRKLYLAEMESNLLNKIARDGEEGDLSQVKRVRVYIAIKECVEEYGYPIEALCRIAHASRSAYYNWLKNVESPRKKENEYIMTLLEQLFNEDTSKGYRRLRDDLDKRYGIKISGKRALRLCRVLGIKSTLKYTNNGCTINASKP